MYRFTPNIPGNVYPTKEIEPTSHPGIRVTVDKDDCFPEFIVQVIRFDDTVYQIRCNVEDLGEKRRREHENNVSRARHELSKLNQLRSSFGLSVIDDPDTATA